MSAIDPDEQRATSREAWERAAEGWGNVADRVRAWAMEVSATMVDALALQPGQRVVELAAGPGDTGFMAAELVAPGGTLICSDGAEAMLDVARERAGAQGVTNVEFRQLELEWIDLPTAEVDAVLCRWGIMLIVDSEAAVREIRRILKPGGRAAVAVWDAPERNPWATIPSRALQELGHIPAPHPQAPGMFKLAGDGVLRELLEGAGLTDVKFRAVAMERHFGTLDDYLAETIELASSLRASYEQLSAEQQREVREQIAEASEPYAHDGGELVLPGSTLVASAAA